MKLYYFPDASSLVVNIALRAANISFDLIEVDYVSRQLPDGTDYSRINSKAYVPALVLDDGSCLTEVIAILDWIDFKVPMAALLGMHGTTARQDALTWLVFVATEIHKSFSPLFRPNTPREFLVPGQNHLKDRLSIIETRLMRQQYLCADTPNAADFYVYVMSRWMCDAGICTRDWPAIRAHASRIETLNYVQDALASDIR